MFRLLFIVMLWCMCTNVFAQKADSLFVVSKNDKWYVMHELKKGEDVFQLAQMYHVPPAVLADANSINYQTQLKEKTKLNIPLGNYNEVNFKPVSKGYRNLYYRVTGSDNLFRISHYAGVQQQTLQKWNGLADNSIAPGNILFVGWLLFDKTNPAATTSSSTEISKTGAKKKGDTSYVIVKKKQPIDTLSDEEKLYLAQTDSGKNVVEEKGSAVFFGSGGKIKGTDMFFAFHNTAPKGTVIKVHNPGADKTIYVKVIGPIPGTKQYYNSIIGIGGGAKEELGALEEKTWCELKYGGAN